MTIDEQIDTAARATADRLTAILAALPADGATPPIRPIGPIRNEQLRQQARRRQESK